jgi:hypothetical protein
MIYPINVKWFDDLIWCPSQCYGHLHWQGVDYILYLRWRWDDPWQGHIVKNARDSHSMHLAEAVWSEDLFEEWGLFFRDEELEQAKVALVVEDLAGYPIKRFHQRGIRVTVNTNNPTLLGCSLTDELHL